MDHKIEGYNLLDLGFGQSGTRYFTLSFWHKHTKTGTQSVSFQNSDQNRTYVAEYTQSVSDTWEKAEITIPVDTSGTWLYDNGIGLQVRFCLMVGSTYSGTAGSWSANNYLGSSNQVNNLDSTSNNFKIALVQLEAGDKATRFETRSVQQELELCQRYFERTGLLDTAAFTSDGPLTFIAYVSTEVNGAQFRVIKRSIPTVTIYSSADIINQLTGNTNTATAGYIGQTGFGYIARSGNTVGNGYYGHYEANAEL